MTHMAIRCSRLGILLLGSPALMVGISSTSYAVFPAGVTTVVLSEPSNPSSSSSYSSARFDGLLGGGQAGSSMSAAGDFNADGFLDLAVGAPSADSSKGIVYVLYGAAGEPNGTVSFSSAVSISGATAGDLLGTSIAAGDVTGDGAADLAIGAPGLSGKGGAYVIPGGAPWTSVSSITLLTNLITVNGESSNGKLGSSLAIGDVTAEGTASSDGYSELLIGAPGSGKAYLVYGPVVTGVASSASSTNSYNFTFVGYVEDETGFSVAIVGDMNNDNSKDIVIGGPHPNSSLTTGNLGGISYLINGRGKQYFTNYGSTATLNLNSTFSKKRNIVGDIFYGSTRVGRVGHAVAGVADANYDGFKDIMIGAPTAPKTSSSTPECGRVYVIFGSASVFDTATTTISSGGFPYFYGETSFDHLGKSLHAAGDVDHDGYADSLLGASDADLTTDNPGNGNGAAYLIAGRLTAEWPTSGNIVTASPSIKFYGKYTNDHAGVALFGAAGFDLNNDSFGDFFISAPNFDVSSSQNEGRIYYISFGDFYDKDNDGQSEANADCNELDNTIYYTANGANEVCDGKDNDCDGLTDDDDSFIADPYIFYLDADQDDYGGDILYTCSAIPPASYIAQGGDCDDNDSSINPEGVEVCDSADNDCDGLTDDDDPSVNDQNVYFFDADGDGFGGEASEVVNTCSTEVPAGYSALDTDCNDGDAQINPDADEYCDGVDTNCNDAADDHPVDGEPVFVDADLDSFGDPQNPDTVCSLSEGYSYNSDDCNDADPLTFPGAAEQCDAEDNNCDGSPDEEVPEFDQDSDGYLDDAQCSEYGAATGLDLDCDDTDPLVNPGEDEVDDDGIDNDCDGRTDEAGGCGNLTRTSAPAGAALFLFNGLFMLVLMNLVKRRRG